MVLVILLVLCCAAVSASCAEELAVSRFASDGLTGWQQKSFKGNTGYELVTDSGRILLKAQSNGTASGLIKKIRFDPQNYRYLTWSWKVEQPIEARCDEKNRDCDDYAARVYVVFPGTMFWQTRAINYVWANRLPKGQMFANPYTKNAMMLVVESGRDKVGTLVSEERDIVADYQQLFGASPPEATAIAIMTDSDNTGSRAIAWYGEISLKSRR